MYSFEVNIGDNVWIGSNVVICPGVTIGENSVIGAGSIVLHDVPANCVAAGNPCRVIREITTEIWNTISEICASQINRNRNAESVSETSFLVQRSTNNRTNRAECFSGMRIKYSA